MIKLKEIKMQGYNMVNPAKFYNHIMPKLIENHCRYGLNNTKMQAVIVDFSVEKISEDKLDSPESDI